MRERPRGVDPKDGCASSAVAEPAGDGANIDASRDELRRVVPELVQRRLDLQLARHAPVPLCHGVRKQGSAAILPVPASRGALNVGQRSRPRRHRVENLGCKVEDCVDLGQCFGEFILGHRRDVRSRVFDAVAACSHPPDCAQR
jgi:hypothetical protein